MSQGNQKKGGHNKKGLKSNKKKGWGSKLSSITKGFKPGGAKIHGKPGGGGNPYGSNNVGMTISQAKKLYANQLAEGISLQEAMKYNKAETVSYWDLLDEKNDTKKTNSTNNMAQSDQDWLKGAYKTAFGEDREANFDAKGGAQYWLDQMKSNPTSHSRDEVLRMLKGSDEGKKFAASGVTMPGGVDPTKSIYSQFKNDPGNTWLQHWAPGGSLAEANVDDTFSAVNKSLTTVNPTGSYFNFDDSTFTPNDPSNNGGGSTPPPGLTVDDLDKWWDAKNKDKGDDNGMGDFMKFMMLMSVMGGKGGMGGGGYQGSQYGYGGLTPGGVQAAYDPMKYISGMGTWFKDNFGSGSGSSSSSTGGDSASSSALNMGQAV
tara:strand:+ start:87 stop:1208 length:1122 start_codon:yes stop_codon:yes gene_type:complete